LRVDRSIRNRRARQDADRGPPEPGPLYPAPKDAGRSAPPAFKRTFSFRAHPISDHIAGPRNRHPLQEMAVGSDNRIAREHTSPSSPGKVTNIAAQAPVIPPSTRIAAGCGRQSAPFKIGVDPLPWHKQVAGIARGSGAPLTSAALQTGPPCRVNASIWPRQSDYRGGFSRCPATVNATFRRSSIWRSFHIHQKAHQLSRRASTTCSTTLVIHLFNL
jgi:hypothetical protein